MSSLYLDHFGLSKPPFQITPDIDFFFSGSQRGDILTALLHVAGHEEGIVMAVAEVGSGKTLLARLLLSRLPDHVSTVYLANPCFSRDEIVSAIARDLGINDLPASIEEKLARLHQELLNRHARGERVLLVIDEAHTMPAESLEEVRLLSNLETSHHKLVNIMLFGQPELDALLGDPRLRQVRDRVIHRFELPPLPHDEGVAYIDHRLRTAGWRGGKLFTKGAIERLLKAAGGRARRINLLADKALLAVYAEGGREVEERHVKAALRDLQAAPQPRPAAPVPWKLVAPISLGLAALMTVAAVWLLERGRPAPPPGATAAIAPAPPAPAAAAPAATRPSPVAAIRTPSEPPPAPAVTDVAQLAFDRTARRLRDPALGGLTLQLTSLPTASNLTEYLRNIGKSVDIQLVYAHNRNYRGKPYVAVYFGSFETEADARAALNALPKTLTADAPMIRTWNGIRREAAL